MSSTPLRPVSASALILGGLLIAPAAHAQITSPAVGTWASNNNVTALAPGSSLSIAAFKTEIETAFTNGLGGNIDFETGANIGDSTSIISSYNGGANTLTITITGGALNTNNNNEATSGTRYAGQSGSSADRTLTFSTPLSVFGLVGLSRGVDRDATITLTLQDTSTVVVGPDTIGAASDHTLFNYKAVGGNNIVSVVMNTPTGFTRFDDFAFVTAIPEPASAATLVGLTAIGFVALRRRRARS